jgi:hypothetical protein
MFSGRLPVEEQFYVTVIDDDTKMEYLVPTTSDAGVCTTALVDFLTLTHNNFIATCGALVGENDQRYVDITVLKADIGGGRKFNGGGGTNNLHAKFFGHAPLIGVQSSHVAQLDMQLLPQLKMDSERAQRSFLEPAQLTRRILTAP